VKLYKFQEVYAIRAKIDRDFAETRRKELNTLKIRSISICLLFVVEGIICVDPLTLSSKRASAIPPAEGYHLHGFASIEHICTKPNMLDMKNIYAYRFPLFSHGKYMQRLKLK
jgi:hypothetical protein